MNTPGEESAASTEALPPQGERSAAPPRLGKSVSADLEALKNDVEQARALACEYQQQLAGKSNDHASLKLLFEKTREDLIHLQSGVEQLRQERHQLANEAMKAAALELKVARLTAERDRLLAEVEELRARPAPARPPAKPPQREYISMPFTEVLADEVTIVPTEAGVGSAARKFRRG